jgi:hypothetical protein
MSFDMQPSSYGDQWFCSVLTSNLFERMETMEE